MAENDATETDAASDRSDEVEVVDGEEHLGDPGKKALATMKERLRKEREERKALADELAKAKASASDKPDADKIRAEAKAEALAAVLRERALDKVETKAAKAFADPEDARAFLADKVDEFIADGKVDVGAIDKALTDLLERKPHLGAATAKRFEGGADGGARNGSTKPQLSRAEVARMYREGKVAEIETARLEGRIDYGSK